MKNVNLRCLNRVKNDLQALTAIWAHWLGLSPTPLLFNEVSSTHRGYGGIDSFSSTRSDLVSGRTM